jgi:hypothetical protein
MQVLVQALRTRRVAPRPDFRCCQDAAKSLKYHDPKHGPSAKSCTLAGLFLVESTGFEPVTSCLQRVLAGDRRSRDFQGFWGLIAPRRRFSFIGFCG